VLIELQTHLHDIAHIINADFRKSLFFSLCSFFGGVCVCLGGGGLVGGLTMNSSAICKCHNNDFTT